MSKSDATKDEWAAKLGTLKHTDNSNDDDLRSATLGAIRRLSRDEDSIYAIRAVLKALDEVLLEP